MKICKVCGHTHDKVRCLACKVRRARDRAEQSKSYKRSSRGSKYEKYIMAGNQKRHSG